jgi:hypothetical protein
MSDRPDKLWWLSFVNPDNFWSCNNFMFVVVTMGKDPLDAVQRFMPKLPDPNARLECAGIDFPDEMVPFVPESYRDRCLSREEAEALDQLIGDVDQ